MSTKILKDEQGIALIVALWVMALLSVLVTEFADSMRMELKISRNFIEETQCYYLARAGLEAAMSEILAEDMHYIDENGIVRFGRKDTSEISVLPEEELPPQRENIALGSGFYSYYIEDERLKIDLNYLCKQGEGRYRPVMDRLFDYIGLEDEVTRDTIIDSILDWYDENQEHHLNGAEDDWYEKNFAEQGFNEPYGAKDGSFDVLEELLMVHGVTPEIFYGKTESEDSSFSNNNSSNSKNDKGLEKTESNLAPEFDNQAGYGKGLRDFFTIFGQGPDRNIASPEIVSIYFGSDLQEEIEKTQKSGDEEKIIRYSRSKVFTIESTGTIAGKEELSQKSKITRTIRVIVGPDEKKKTKLGKTGLKGDKPRLAILQWDDNAKSILADKLGGLGSESDLSGFELGLGNLNSKPGLNNNNLGSSKVSQTKG